MNIFTKDLDEIDLKFFGLFIMIILVFLLLINKNPTIAAILVTPMSFMIRDLYRRETKKNAKSP